MQLENEKLIKRFLFGEMSEDERFEFEERFITDADLFEQIKVSADELIEKYIRGWMNPAERTKFEKNFLTTAKRRERVEFSRQMFNKIDEQKEKAIPVKKNDGIIAEESIWQKLGGLFLSPKIATAAAFAVLVAIFSVWFLYQNLSNKNPEFAEKQESNSSEIPKETFSPTPEISPVESTQNSENENIEGIENAENDSDAESDKTPLKTPTPNDKIQKTPVPPKTPQIQKSAPSPVLALFAGTLRSDGKNNVLNLPETAKGATLQLNPESVDYKYYQARLTDADGNVIFQKDRLAANKSKISLFIPAEKLVKGDYLLKLYGINASGENESVADFQFRVNR